MRFIRFSDDIKDAEAPDLRAWGGKARGLRALSAEGIRVPAWCVVLPEAHAQAADDGMPSAELRTELAEALARLKQRAPEGDARFAVRSSAVDEDGSDHSFAGQLESFLFVEEADVPDRVAAVWRSGFSERVLAYRAQRGISGPPPAPAVLIQRMLHPEAAGVAFSADPITGRRSVAVVSAVPGMGSGLVSGECDADTFRIDRDGRLIGRDIASKRTAHRWDPNAREGVSAQPVADPAAPAISDEAALEIAALARRGAAIQGQPQDIEWAIEKGALHALQSRPITSLRDVADPDGVLTVWDNSNIAESYNGVTTPLTFSFARGVYEEVYREFCRILAVPRADIEAHAQTFRCMLGLIRGRIYYNLLNWYRVLALLPGFGLNRAFMEQMMGVRRALPEELVEAVLRERRSESRAGAWLRAGRGVAALVGARWRLPETIRSFNARLTQALALEGGPARLATLRLDELARHFRELERQLVTRWDAPLVNDFFAMIFFGVLRKLCAQWLGDELRANALIMASGDIISAEPARRIRRMAESLRDEPELIAAWDRAATDPLAAREALARRPRIAAEFDAYLERFGDRCWEELKLETVTLGEDPSSLMQAIARLARDLRSRAPEASGAAPERGTELDSADGIEPAGWLRARVFRWILSEARDRVRDRENLRFERTRVFGRVRRIFLEMGRRLSGEGILDDARDVFYLTTEEVLGLAEGTAVSWQPRPSVASRRAEFEGFRSGPAPDGRFTTRGAPSMGNTCEDEEAPTDDSADAPGETGDTRRGLGCCPGIVRARALVIVDPRGAELAQGDILVAERTDPGWILLFAAAGGVIVEHGSLLSHSAIVAREMKIPCAVGVPGVTRWIADGDDVELDGARGLVRRMRSA